MRVIESINDLTSRDIIEIFLMAAKAGWCKSGEVKKQEIPALPGYKVIYFKFGDFEVQDAYCTTPLNQKSAGFTTIWFKKIPVWTMNYGGSYPEYVIPFLKLALQETINENKFIGGRGPFHFTHGNYPGLSYTNQLTKGQRVFSDFSGKEWIFERDCPVGSHEYWGMSLI